MLEMPGNLAVRFSDYGRKPKYSAKTYAHMGRTCKFLLQTAPLYVSIKMIFKSDLKKKKDMQFRNLIKNKVLIKFFISFLYFFYQKENVMV